MTFTLFTGASINCCSLSFGRLLNIDFMRRKSPSARTPEVPERVRYQKTKPNFIAFHSFSTIFSYKWSGYTSVYSMKSMFWTNEKLSLMVAWSSSVSISCFRVQSSIGHLVWLSNNFLEGTWGVFILWKHVLREAVPLTFFRKTSQILNPLKLRETPLNPLKPSEIPWNPLKPLETP